MQRFSYAYLEEWKDKPGRKPLLIRGARQVGKSHLTRQFGQTLFENMVELNLEKEPGLSSLFKSNDPSRIVPLIEVKTNSTITPGKTLLFIDEIQAAPEVIASLRYFFESMPSLHVVSAGSLLEFALAEHPVSVPVGRIEYLHLGPMIFEEFLMAKDLGKLVSFVQSYHAGDLLPEAIHSQLMAHFKEYVVTGGMPQSVFAYADTGSFRRVDEAKNSILSTFRDDFAKYRRRIDFNRLRKVFDGVPALVGTRLKYSKIDPGERSADLSRAMDLLCMARVVYRVRHTAANGIPLGAQARDANFKALFLDVGLVCTALGLSVPDIERTTDLLLVNSGALAEQVVGQHLLYSMPLYHEPEAYYWAREKSNSAAEVDYVISEGTTVLPVEVKAGKTGTLKSLHLFLLEKNRNLGIRLNSDPPSVLDVTAPLPDGRSVSFRLLSLPLYFAGQLRRLGREQMEESALD